MNNAATLIGIDPGSRGVIAHLSVSGRLLDVYKMPMREMPLASRAGGVVRRVNGTELRALFARLKPSYAVLEQVCGMSGDTPMTAFGFGYNYGLVEDAIADAGIPVILAPPAVWKGDMKLSADKGLSKPRAWRLFPHGRDLLTSVDKAEAALIGLWGMLSGRTPALL